MRRPDAEEVPERPIGAKLEMTYHCNLRCDFCYTDSPRRTIARTLEMSDEEWGRIIDEVIDSGVIEAVVTGGEPLLRRDLTLDTVDRLTTNGVMVTLNTNGWFVDEEVADRLAASGARVHVSIDGASRDLHEASRGVPGSWRRAVNAVDLMLSRGGRVQVVHVVTPENQSTYAEFLDQMRLLAPTSVRVAPVGKIGAASRGGEWDTDHAALQRVTEGFGPHARPRVYLQNGIQGRVLATDLAPKAFLIRPNGAFLADAQHPFSFGLATEQSLAECWEGMRWAWRSEQVENWRSGARSANHFASRDLVPYRDEERAVSGVAPRRIQAKKSGEGLEQAIEILKAKAPGFPEDGRGDIAGATETIRELALARRHRLTPHRWGGSARGERVVRVTGSGQVKALNASAAAVMDALDGGTPADATRSLRDLHPGLASDRAERDALEAAAELIEAGIAVATLARRDDMSMAAADGALDGLPG